MLRVKEEMGSVLQEIDIDHTNRTVFAFTLKSLADALRGAKP